jgi:hypothetical protein
LQLIRVEKYSEQEDDPMEYAHSLVNLAKIHKEKNETLHAELALLCSQEVLDNWYTGFSFVHWLVLKEVVEVQVISKNVTAIEESLGNIFKANEKYNAYKWEQFNEWLELLVREHLINDEDKDDKTMKSILLKLINEVEEKIGSIVSV